MTNSVNGWVQEGQFFVWRYAKPSRHWCGWHFTADQAGCRSIRDLLDRMDMGGASYRTLRLDHVTEAILGVPNSGNKCGPPFSKLRVEFQPGRDALSLHEDGDMLRMVVGHKRLRTLYAALTSVEIGEGDFGIETSDDRKALPWMFWWMPNKKIETMK